jgi:hypothetical protein
MSPADRNALEIRQRSLVAALVAGADPPPGMDGGRVRVQAAALAGKRARAVARAQPELAAALGLAFGPAFRAYVSDRPGGKPDCTAADAEAFARYLRDTGQARTRDARRAVRRLAGRRPFRRVSA